MGDHCAGEAVCVAFRAQKGTANPASKKAAKATKGRGKGKTASDNPGQSSRQWKSARTWSAAKLQQ